jgi:hypothetical protein
MAKTAFFQGFPQESRRSLSEDHLVQPQTRTAAAPSSQNAVTGCEWVAGSLKDERPAVPAPSRARGLKQARVQVRSR